MNLPLYIDRTPSGKIVESAKIGEEGYGENEQFELHLIKKEHPGPCDIEYHGDDGNKLSDSEILKVIQSITEPESEPVVLSDEDAYDLLVQIDNYAIGCDAYEYGLPIHALDEEGRMTKNKLIHIVKKWARDKQQSIISELVEVLARVDKSIDDMKLNDRFGHTQQYVKELLQRIKKE